MSLPVKMRKNSRTFYITGSIFCVGIMVTMINIYELRTVKYSMEFEQNRENKVGPQAQRFREEKTDSKQNNVPETLNNNYKQIAWIYAINWDSEYLKHVRLVLNRLGYQATNISNEWDLLWSHEYPFGDELPELNSLKPHQRVNHFPGSGYITNKVNLATSKYSFVPKAFRLPGETSDFLKYTEKHSQTLWVQKSTNHRGIKIVPVKQLDLAKPNTFVQEYVQKPFLIDDRKFDIGIYTIITSINPLRVYVVDGDALFRFCSRDYYPFDAADVDKYVVSGDYTPLWQMPSLKTAYTEMSYSFKETFNAYLQQKGYNATDLWKRLYRAVAEVCMDKEIKLIVSAKPYLSTRNFFELMRFDFVLDASLSIYLMEVNMSPNLSSGHFPPNKRLYEHVLYTTLSLVGIGKRVTSLFMTSNDDEMTMQASDQGIQIFSQSCLNECSHNCEPIKCKLCTKCMHPDTRLDLKLAYMEHENRGSSARVYPPPMTQQEARDWLSYKKAPIKFVSKTNNLMMIWFMGKCIEDIRWCT